MELMLLPSELLMAIAIDLDLRDLLRCRQVCARLKTLIDEDIRAEYKIELAAAGMKDGPPSTLTTAKRLSILRAHQDAWNKFAWTTREDIPMQMGDVWELYGNVLAQSEGNRTLHFKQIPSAIRGIEGTEWVVPDVGCNMKDFGLDPAQDLLIVLEDFEDDSQLTYRIHLHLKSLSTGAPYPGSTTPMLTHNPQLGGYSYDIHISEGYLGILMSSQEFGDPSELLIWEWKLGTLCMHITGHELLSWAFLTSRFVLIAQGGSEYDEENTTVQEPRESPHFVVIDLESLPSSNPIRLSQVDYVCAFHYPSLEDNVDVNDMLIRSDPGANWCPSPALGVPFSVSREDRLFVTTLRLMKGHRETVLLSLVPASTFLRVLATLVPGDTRHEFVWSEWGPRGSRFMRAPTMHGETWVCYVYGTTFVAAERRGESGRWQKLVAMLDFNELATRRAQGWTGGDHPAEDEQDIIIVADANVFEPAGLFKEEVTTVLPYRQRVFTAPFERVEDDGEFNAVMLAEDALVLVSSGLQTRHRYRILSI